MKIIISVLLLIIISLGIGTAIYFFIENKENSTRERHINFKCNYNKTLSSIKEENIINIKTITTNIKQRDGKLRYLKIKLALEVSDKVLKNELNKNTNVITDLIINSIRVFSAEKLKTKRGKDKLKASIVNNINQIISDFYIKDIYISEFIIQ